MAYTDSLRIRVDKDKRKVFLSIKLTENTVISQEIDFSEWQRLIAKYHAAMDAEK